MFRWILCLPLLVVLAGNVQAADGCADLIEQSNLQLEAVRRHARTMQKSLEGLNDALLQAEQRNVELTRQIEKLQAELRAQRSSDPGEQVRQQRNFFKALRNQLPVSSLYQVLPDRLVVANDPVYVFGTGEIGAEGRDRLAPMVEVLKQLIARLPEEFPWRLRIEGHSDSRPIRSFKQFESNWELSAARAVSMLRFLAAEGLPQERLAAVGLADTYLRDPGDSAAAHRRNRRVEIHLVYDAAADE